MQSIHSFSFCFFFSFLDEIFCKKVPDYFSWVDLDHLYYMMHCFKERNCGSLKKLPQKENISSLDSLCIQNVLVFWNLCKIPRITGSYPSQSFRYHENLKKRRKTLMMSQKILQWIQDLVLGKGFCFSIFTLQSKTCVIKYNFLRYIAKLAICLLFALFCLLYCAISFGIKFPFGSWNRVNLFVNFHGR